jgi:hypothetical protein
MMTVLSQVSLPWMGSWRLLKLFIMVTMISRAKFSMKSWTSLNNTTTTSGKPAALAGCKDYNFNPGNNA